MESLFLVVLVGLVFYMALPLWGAWRVRKGWNHFRARCLEALSSLDVDLTDVDPNGPGLHEPRRLLGTLEAFEGEDRLWISNADLSLPVSLKGSAVYFLDDQPDPFVPGVEPPRRAEPSLLGALPEGTGFLVFGSLVRDGQGQVQFADNESQRLLVLAFEGDPQTVLHRAIYAGRSPIDHWNAWTPVSLAAGMTLLLFLGYANLQSGGWRSGGILALAGALPPSTFFLPPGILLFYAFARFWTQARDRRARMDLIRLSLGVRSRSWKGLRSEARRREWLAHAALGLGMLSNAGLLASLLRVWVP